MKNIKRKIGYIALVAAAISFVCFLIMGASFKYGMQDMLLILLTYAFSGIVAFVCLVGDGIRFIGRCFSQGFNGTQKQESNRFCTNCGKPISAGAHFCSHCGSKQDTNT